MKNMMLNKINNTTTSKEMFKLEKQLRSNNDRRIVQLTDHWSANPTTFDTTSDMINKVALPYWRDQVFQIRQNNSSLEITEA